MSKEKPPGRQVLDRRTLLRSGAAAAFAAPLGVFGAQALPFRAAAPAIDFSEFPICRTASDATPLTGAPRKLKLSWNAGAVCLAPVPIAIAQADLGAAARWGFEGPARTLDAYLRLTAEAFDRGYPQIVFWPEVALTVFLEQDRIYQQALAAALGRYDAELVAGAPRAGGPDGTAPFTNSVYLLAPDGVVRARYDKQYLLPFMEYFPLRVELARRRFGGIREFTPGEPTAPLPTRAGNAGILICNEGLLPHVGVRRIAEGAAYLVNPSNDSWVPDAGFAWQQFDIVSLRAVEERRYLIRVSDSGPSGVVDPFGRVVTHTEALTRGVLLASVVPITGRTPYASVGDLFGGACLLATALALIRCRRRGDRRALRP